MVALGACSEAERARNLLQQMSDSPPQLTNGSSNSEKLTQREREVLRLVADGFTDKEIAERLRLSAHTVHRHLGNVRTKLDVPSRSAAVSKAARLGWI